MKEERTPDSGDGQNTIKAPSSLVASIPSFLGLILGWVIMTLSAV